MLCLQERINLKASNFFFLGLYCNATTDEIGTCWPRSSSGRIVERPCPEYINGVKYNTTSKSCGNKTSLISNSSQ